MRYRNLFIAPALFTATVIACTSCKREDRDPHVEPPAAGAVYLSTTTDLQAGGVVPTTQSTHVTNQYEQNAYGMSQGQRLYESYNCVGCHSHGGGGIGPPLMDQKWIYGGQPEQIFATIVQGRPNGMPSFRGRIPDFQVWQIAAYVRSMSGNANTTAAPNREDHMSGKTPENSVTTEPPVNTTTPDGTH